MDEKQFKNFWSLHIIVIFLIVFSPPRNKIPPGVPPGPPPEISSDEDDDKDGKGTTILKVAFLLVS